jgi:hypothetical protein
MVAKLELVSEGGEKKKAKVRLTREDIDRLCRKTNKEGGGFHTHCKKEKWLEKRNRIDAGPKAK